MPSVGRFESRTTGVSEHRIRCPAIWTLPSFSSICACAAATVATSAPATRSRNDNVRTSVFPCGSFPDVNTAMCSDCGGQSIMLTRAVTTSARTRTARNASATPSRASPSGPASRSSMSSMMRRSPVRTLSRHARASRPFWIGSRATACVPSSSRMPAGLRAS